jgi:hypothetical protein
VLAGCHPISRSRAPATSFYLVISTFRFFPGIPVFESADLVYWKQIGNVIERPSQLDFDGLSVSRGVFAPSIAFHDGTVLKAVPQAPWSAAAVEGNASKAVRPTCLRRSKSFGNYMNMLTNMR